MRSHVHEYRIPTHLEQALRLLAERGDRAAVVAGGSVQALRLPSRVHTLVDVLRCGLDEIQVDSRRAHIGATAPAAAIAATAALDACGAGILREAAQAISPQAVRNQVTVAGNLAGHMSWSDLPLALLALDAVLETASGSGAPRKLGIGELLAAHPRKVLDTGEVITGVEITPTPAGAAGAFVKLARTASDVALVSAAALLHLHGGRCQGVRVVLGAVQPRPVRSQTAEQMLEGQAPSEALFAEAAAAAAAEAQVNADMRASKEYRRRILAVAAKRALITAWRRAAGEERYDPPRQVSPPPWTRKPPGREAGRILTVRVDGAERRIPIRPDELLLDVLRRDGVLSVKRGCDEGYCGTCSVLVDGRLLNACLVLAAQVEGCTLTTAAGIGTIFNPHPLQKAMVEEGAVQCGFCTPGFVVAGKALLDAIPAPTEDELRFALDGNLCRCTGYVKPLKAVQRAATLLQEKGR